MLEVIVLIILGIVWLLFATIQDIRTSEVSNWLNFSLVIFALAFRFFYSFFEAGNFSFFYQGLIGFVIFFILGNVFYYGKIFAGGDAKLMMALGPILPFFDNFSQNSYLFLMFLLLFLFSGAVYGIIWSVILVSKNFNSFKKFYISLFKKNKKILNSVVFFGLAFMILGFFESLFFYLGILLFILPYFYIYAKSVDKCCMVKRIKTKSLREGDWLYERVKIGKSYVEANWSGLTIKEINLIRKKYKDVLIHEGVPFTPAFLVSFFILVLLYILDIKVFF